jgi:hypothetical protein
VLEHKSAALAFGGKEDPAFKEQQQKNGQVQEQ